MFKSSAVSAHEPVFVSVSEWNGKDRFDIRHFYSDGGELKPGTKGINVPLEDANAVITAILAVIEIAVTSPHGESKIQPKTSGSMPVIVSVNEWKGVRRIDIRHYWKPKGQSKLLPTQKGVSIEISQVSAIRDALYAASETIGKPAASTTPTAARPESVILSELGYAPTSNDKRFSNVEL